MVEQNAWGSGKFASCRNVMSRGARFARAHDTIMGIPRNSSCPGQPRSDLDRISRNTATPLRQFVQICRLQPCADPSNTAVLTVLRPPGEPYGLTTQSKKIKYCLVSLIIHQPSLATFISEQIARLRPCVDPCARTSDAISRATERYIAKQASAETALACSDSLVGLTGFEPAAPASRTRCSTKLSHNPKARLS